MKQEFRLKRQANQDKGGDETHEFNKHQQRLKQEFRKAKDDVVARAWEWSRAKQQAVVRTPVLGCGVVQSFTSILSCPAITVCLVCLLWCSVWCVRAWQQNAGT